MDLTTFDATALGENAPTVGDYLTLIGEGATLEDVAFAAGTIGYEILTGIGARVVRDYAGTERP
jgi:alanine racemase